MGSGLRRSLSLFRDREFVALSGTAFARAQAYSTIAIALALYADMFGTTSTVEGLFGTAFALIQLLIVLPLGRLVDTGNAKRYLLAGLVVNLGVFVGFAMVETVEHVILMRVLQGVGASLLWITGTAVVGQISPDDERGRWLGVYNQVGAFSSLAGDLLGGALLALYGFTAAYAALSLVTLLATVAVYTSLRDEPGGRADADAATGVETLRQLLDRAAIRALVVFRFGLSFGKMAVLLFLPIYARTTFGMSAFLIGGILAGGKLTKTLTQGVIGDYTDRVGHKHHFIVAGALLYAVGAAMIPLAAFADGVLPRTVLDTEWGVLVLPAAFWVLFGAYGVCGLADSLRLPASMALFVEEGEHFDAVAGSMSLRSIAWKVGQVTGPVTVGVLWDATNVFVAFGTASALIGVSTLAFVTLFRNEPEPEVVGAASD